jgi:hypothetical protein
MHCWRLISDQWTACRSVVGTRLASKLHTLTIIPQSERGGGGWGGEMREKVREREIARERVYTEHYIIQIQNY